MFLHNKKSLLKKALSIATVVVLIVTAIIGVVKHINKQVDAATPEGQPVTVTKEYNIFYGDHWGTNRFSIGTSGQNITGYCSNPSKKSLEGTFPAVILPSSSTNNAIVLMIYVSTVNNSVTQSVMNDLFSSISDEDQRYAYSHATIGALYANDYYKLNSSDVNMVNGIITKLQNMISSQSDAWLMAQNYRLYTIDRTGTEYADSNEYQDIMWVEDNDIYGNIKVQKKDSDTNSSTPQGGASLQGIRFEVYNNSGSRIYNPKTNAFYNNGALVDSGTTNANGEITFSNLVAGSYSVKETATNGSYDLTSTSAQTTTITASGQTQTLSFYNTVKKGSIKVSKKDIELNVCEQLGKSQFTGVNFQVINDSASPVYYNGSSVAVGSMVADKSLNTGDCEVTFSDLPYGKYIVREYSTGVGFVSNSQTYSVTIPSNNTVNLSVEFKNQVIRGDVKFKKINKNDNKPMANILFRITSKTTGESHIVVSDANGIVNTSASFNAHSNHTNGYDAISNPSTITYQNYGTWFGKSSSSTKMALANDSLGALPYDEYEIIEISCDQNKFCYDIASEKQSFEIKNNNVVVDLGNWENDCPSFSLTTTAVDATDGDKYIVVGSTAKIKDTISYCLKTNTNFTIKGTLMDKTTGQPLMKNGSVIEQTIDVNSSSECGAAEMNFEFDASSLASHEIVVFEKVYYGDNLIVSHEDLNDDSQTVYIISLSTLAQNGSEIIDDEETEKGEGNEDSDGDESGENNTNSEEGEIVDEEGANAGNDGETNNGEDQEEGNEEETPSDKAKKKYIEASKEAKIKDTISYCLRKDVKFTIKGTLIDKTTGEPLKLEDEIIEKSIEITPEEACGVTEMNFEFDASSLAGHDIVVFERLYYNDRLILSHEDIEDEGQTVYIIDLTTYATNSKDGSKDVAASGIVKIIDKVKYCLKAKTEFTVKGILMDKKTEKPLLIDGKPVEQTIVFIPENTCGETEMVYEFDATGLGGMEVVIFEDVYQGEELLIKHRDFANLNETFYLRVPAPDTGFVTKTLEGGSENNITFIAIATAAVFSVAGIYGGIRIKSRKKFLGHF